MEKKGNAEFTERRRLAEVYTESLGEYSLPDYERDVRKILYSSATVHPAGRFVGNDDIAFSGIIVYNLVYVDPEGRLSSLSFTSDYDYSVKCSPESSLDSYASTRVASFAVRLIGPRRVSARASVVGSVSLLGKRELSVSGDGFSMNEPPVAEESKINVRSSRFGESEEREYAERLDFLDGALLDEVEVVYSDAVYLPEGTTVRDGECEMKGALLMTAVIKNADEPPYHVSKRIPVSEEIKIDGLTEGEAVIPRVGVSSVKTAINPDETGCEIVMSVIIEASACAEYNEEALIVTDAYLTECPSLSEYEEFGYTELLSVERETWGESTTIPKAELESQRPREVLFVTATPKTESVKCAAKGVEITGEIKYEGVISETSEEGNVCYLPIKYSAPFKRNVNINCQNHENLEIEPILRAHSPSAVIDGDNIILETELEAYMTLLSPRSKRRLSALSAKADEPYKASASVITVYYPTEEDTLFSVAKRFHTTPERIAEDNAVEVMASSGVGDSDSLKGVKKLLIY